MREAHILRRSQRVPAPLDEVFPFFADAGNLQVITPAFLHFRFLTPLPIAMGAGSRIDYRIRLFGIPMRWQTAIAEFEAPRRFVDRQDRGPYRAWIHTHEFRSIDGGTEIVDQVQYQLPLGPLGEVAHALWVRRTLGRIFDFRRDRIAERFGTLSAGHGADLAADQAGPASEPRSRSGYGQKNACATR